MFNHRLTALVDSSPEEVQDALKYCPASEGFRLEEVDNIQLGTRQDLTFIGDPAGKLNAMRVARDRGRYLPVGRDLLQLNPLITADIGTIVEHDIPLPAARPTTFNVAKWYRYWELASKIQKDPSAFPEYGAGRGLLDTLRGSHFPFTAFVSSSPSFRYRFLCEYFPADNGSGLLISPGLSPLVFSSLLP